MCAAVRCEAMAKRTLGSVDRRPRSEERRSLSHNGTNAMDKHAGALRALFRLGVPPELELSRDVVFGAAPLDFSGLLPITVSEIHHGKDPRTLRILSPVVINEPEGATFLWEAPQSITGGLSKVFSYLQTQVVLSDQAPRGQPTAPPDSPVPEGLQTINRAVRVAWGMVTEIDYGPHAAASRIVAHHILFGTYLFDPELGEVLCARNNAAAINIVGSALLGIGWVPVQQTQEQPSSNESRGTIHNVTGAIQKYAFLSRK